MDQLFLLKPGFLDAAANQEGRKYYCPSCAAVEGVLHYYPQSRERLEVIYVDFPRPRKEIIDLLGEVYQGCPVLVIDENKAGTIMVDSMNEANGRRFINSTTDILKYLAEAYGIGFPHP